MATAAEVIAGTADWGIDCCDALAGLRGLPDGCVQCCLTSPPFFGLRDYGTATWEGGDPDCDHKPTKEWLASQTHASSGLGGQPRQSQMQALGARAFARNCPRCGARRVDRQIGLEETPGDYVARLVEVFREVKRVLHTSGVLWLNLGDSFAGGKSNAYDGMPALAARCRGGSKTLHLVEKPERSVPPGLKAKDLLGIPWLVAFALRADGWYLRCAPPLVKDNCMPESVRDRPTTAHEYWFLLAKSARYFWDADAVRVPYAMTSWTAAADAAGVTMRGQCGQRSGPKGKERAAGAADGQVYGATSMVNAYGNAGRNMRTSDIFDQGLDDLIEQERAWLAHLEHVRAQGGMLLDREGDPLALCYPTFAFPGAHFATFSPHMITPLLKAATSERGCCPACGAPWVRETEARRPPHRKVPGDHGPRPREGMRMPDKFNTERRTVGWQPSCACPPADAVPCLVLDCFAGSGTVGLVARRLGRRFVGLDLNAEYCDMARRRIAQDQPLFNGAAPAPAPPPGRTLFDSLAPEED